MASQLTAEEKAHWAPMLKDVWHAIGPDCGSLLPQGRNRRAVIIELVCDADRPVTNGGMTREEYRVLCDVYHLRSTQQWLRSILNF